MLERTSYFLARMRSYLFAALSAVFLFYAAKNWLVSMRELRRFYTNLPIWDTWDYLAHFSRYQHFDLTVFWIQHNEHRNIGTEISFAIDMLLLHGQQLLPLLLGIACYILVLLIFIAFAFPGTVNQWAIAGGSALIFVLAGYKICVVSLASPFLTCWPQLEFFSVAALAAVVLHKKRGGKLMLGLAIWFCIAATYSLSNGMFMWPLVIAAGWLLRFTWKELALVAAAGSAAIGSYFYHYNNMHTLDAGMVLGHLGYAMQFTGSFLGMPFSAAFGMSRPWLACVCGWIALAIAALDLVLILLRRAWSAPAVLVMGGYCVLALLSTILTAAGRMNPVDPYLIASRAGRYVTEPTLFWCALIMLTVWLLADTWHGYAALPFMAGIGIFAAQVLPHTTDYYAWWEAYFQRGQWAAIGAGNGVFEKEISDILFPGPDYVAQYKHVLFDNHLAEFSGPEPGWVGRYAREVFRRLDDRADHGEVTTVKKLGQSYEVQGWAEGVSKVVFVDASGRIVGYGIRPGAGPVELFTNDVPRSMAFTGFVRGTFHAHEFSVWAVEQDGRHISRLGGGRYQLPE